MDQPQNDPNVHEPVPRSRARRIAKIVGLTLAGLLIALVLVVGIGAWLLGRETTLQRIVAEAEAALKGI